MGDFIIKLLGVITWPGIVVYVLIRYDREIRELIRRIKKVSGAGVNMELEEKATEMIKSGVKVIGVSEKAINQKPELKPLWEKEKNAFINSAMGTVQYFETPLPPSSSNKSGILDLLKKELGTVDAPKNWGTIDFTKQSDNTPEKKKHS